MRPTRKPVVTLSNTSSVRTRRSLRESTTVEPAATSQDETLEVEAQEGAGFEAKEEVLEEELMTFDTLCLYDWAKVTMPSTLWAFHRHCTGNYAAFSHLAENTSDTFISTDKTVLFDTNLEAQIFVRGRKLEQEGLSEQVVHTVKELDTLMRNVETLSVCLGTGLERPRYSAECTLVVEKKCRSYRCENCSVARTITKKTQAQRVRRAAARKKEHLKTVSLFTDSGADSYERVQFQEMEESNPEELGEEYG